ncbi:MAG: large conductance mechanosensitive channel protein MscL [Clostridia bacterium]|nr:large conductance mechanosensitive channel protein MscL [Clostridia bacterium]
MSGKKENKFDDVIDATRQASETVSKKSRAFWTDFKKFAVKGNIIDLAIAVVIGTAFNKIVSSLVSCIITPLTAMIIGTGSLSDLKWVLREGVEEDVEAGIEAVSEVAVTYGEFLQVTIDFLVIALSIYVVLKVFLKVKDAFHKRERAEAAERARIAEEKKKAEAAEEAERQAKERREFIEDVAIQADILTEMRDIMLRFEKKLDELSSK